MSNLFENISIGFIGAGNMAKAIIKGMKKNDKFQSTTIYVSHPSSNPSQKLFDNSIIETNSNLDVCDKCDLLILCVKPQVLESVVIKLKNHLDSKRHFIVSVCAGISLEKLENFFNTDYRIARCVISTAAEVGESCCVYSHNKNLSQIDIDRLNTILESIGVCYGSLSEHLLDTSTSLFASGIAYMFMMCDALADGGVKMGLSKQLALEMSIQTMYGASKLMLSKPNTHPQQLKDQVCSPGGTTIHGIHELERHGFKNSLMCAVEAAVKRAKELNK